MIKHMANILVVTASYDFLSPVVNLESQNDGDSIVMLAQFI